MRPGCYGLHMLWSVAAIGAIAEPAHGQSPVARFDLPAETLTRALSRFADATGVQILFDPQTVEGRRGAAVRGTYQVDAALTRLLGGTGLDFVLTEPGVYLVRQRRVPPRQRLRTAKPIPPGTAAGEVAATPAIIVTAARHAQSVQKVSASVDVIGGRGIAANAVSGATGALEGVTGVSTTSQPGGVSINIRGLGADMPSGSTQGSVALEFDGVYSIIALGTTTGFFDVDRIEVIKGPQSTRYGPNAEGGIVNVISRDPRLDDTSGDASMSLGSARLARIEVGQTVPLAKRLALRIAGAAIRRDSWFHPALADTVAQSLRARLLFAPNEDLSARLTWQIDHVGGTGSGSEAGYPILISRVAPYAADSINATSDPWAQGDRVGPGYDPADSHADLTQSAVTGQLAWQASDHVALALTAAHLGIGGNQTSCARSASPWSVAGPGQCYGVHEFAPYGQTSLEVRLHSPDRAAWQWNLGAWFWEFGKTSWAEAYQAVPGPAGAGHVGSRTLALFAETTIPVTARGRLILGARASGDHRVMRPAGVETTYSRDFAHGDFRLGGEFDLTRDVMTYATLASGYRPGGLSYDGASGTARAFSSQSTLAAEAGIKSVLAGGRVRLNLDAFAYRQSHYQDLDTYNGQSVVLPDGTTYVCGAAGGQPPACLLPSFTIARAGNLGLEWRLHILATRHDSLSLDGTMMRARFGRHLGTCATIAAPAQEGCWIGYNDQTTGALHFYRLDGMAQPHSPTLSLNLGYDHVFVLRSGVRVTAGGSASHNSSYWVGPVEDTALLGFQPGYWQWNLTAHLTSPSDHFELSFWAKNLGNYAVKMSTLPAATIGDPRNFGLSAAMRW